MARLCKGFDWYKNRHLRLKGDIDVDVHLGDTIDERNSTVTARVQVTTDVTFAFGELYWIKTKLLPEEKVEVIEKPFHLAVAISMCK